jgi:hypothetical protein
VEVAEKRVFFWQKWLKNVCFLAEVAEKRAFLAEVAERRAFFRWKWLKNVCFFGRSV